jgi:hypothetical protein
MRGATKRRAMNRRVEVRRRCSPWHASASRIALAWALAATPAVAADTLASNPFDLSVTVYRAPTRGSGTIDLDNLGGFALVSETRTVQLPAGVSRLRFEGVADGIEPASAIVTGLPAGVIEKNREGKLLSPEALIESAVGKRVTLLRTDKKTGKLMRVPGTIRSDAGGGVVFESSEGVEALRCSGLAESFSFTGNTDLAATPTLSVLVRSSEPVTRTVTLSYLARGFDWAADYVATLSGDGKTMDLGAWVTLANGDGVGFPRARAQVVAGRLNRESGEVEPLDVGGPILANCWPRGSTSDPPEYLQVKRASPLGAATDAVATTQALAMSPRLAGMELNAHKKVEQEQLGDLKLYRVPDRTTVASRQSKQVRMMDRAAIPIAWVYGADVAVDGNAAPFPASLLIRTTNNTANHLGLPLPSGRVAVFATRGDARLLQHESDMRDLAVDEEVEISMGDTPDVQVTVAKQRTSIDSASARQLPPVPGVMPPVPGMTTRAQAVPTSRSVKAEDINQVDISNARDTEIQFELRLRLPDGARVIRADHALATKNGRPIFRLKIPANGNLTLKYQWQLTAG